MVCVGMRCGGLVFTVGYSLLDSTVRHLIIRTNNSSNSPEVHELMLDELLLPAQDWDVFGTRGIYWGEARLYPIGSSPIQSEANWNTLFLLAV